MGRQKLGAYIRKVDYLKAKPDDAYDSDSDTPSSKLWAFVSECQDAEDITFDELKDAFAAFEAKVCVKNFPELNSDGYFVAETTLKQLESLMSDYIDDHSNKEKSACEVYLHTLMALVKVGPNTSHVVLMEKLIDASPSVEEYVQKLDKESLSPILTTLRVNIKYTPNDECDEQTYGCYIKERFESILSWLSERQCKVMQKEFLDVYLHFHSQMLGISEDLNEEVERLLGGMTANFEDENPYIGLKDASVFKQHLSAVQDLVTSKGYDRATPKDNVAERTMKQMMGVLERDKALMAKVQGHLLNIIEQVEKDTKVSEAGKDVLIDYKCYAEKETGNTNTSTTTEAKGSDTQGSKGKKNATDKTAATKVNKSNKKDYDAMVEAIIGDGVKLSIGDVKKVLRLVIEMLKSGKEKLIEKSSSIIDDDLKESKSLQWKNHIDEAKEMLDVIGKITEEEIQANNSDTTWVIDAYSDFLEIFLKQLKKQKVLSQLQPNLLSLFFDCITVSSPFKSDLSSKVADEDDGYLDFTKNKSDRLAVLKRCEDMIKNQDLPWTNQDFVIAVSNVLDNVVKAYDGDGRNVSPEENKLFMSIFKMCGKGDSIDCFYQEHDDEMQSIKGKVFTGTLLNYSSLHCESKTGECIAPLMPDVVKWTKLLFENDDLSSLLFSILTAVGTAAPAKVKDCLPEIMELMMTSNKAWEVYALIQALYPHNPKAVHDKLPKVFEKLERVKDSQKSAYTNLIQMIAKEHAKVFTSTMIIKLLDVYKRTSTAEKPFVLSIIRGIAEKNSRIFVDLMPQFCDDIVFTPTSLDVRSSIIAGIGGLNKKLGQQAVDYLMKFATDQTVAHYAVGSVSHLSRDHVEYLKKYKADLQQLEASSTVPQVRDLAHNMVLMLEGKTVENIAEDVQEQKEDIADLDVKVDATIGTVITMGEKVVEHDKEIGELGEGLEKVEERVDDVEEDLGETKIKVEDIDNKTMTNAPKWSRDLTKLMNPKSDNDWRLLASRLGYTNDDIRGWATQHDPCMALLSEWYATHKTSEASFGVLNALTEMNRMDGAAIVENAMKQAEDVVEDEEFEYPSPPAVFISYQWGYQNEVKLLKHHLNMAGYECWMDVGQMGGGDKLFAKIDNGIRGAKIVICCVTEKYAQSPNCNREVNLSVNLNKPIIPLLMEKMDWPPKGSMGPIFSEYLFIRFFQRGGEETPAKDQRYWPIPKFQELLMQLNFYVVPDQKMVKKEYAKWWAPIVEDIVVDKNKGKKSTGARKPQQESQVVTQDQSPLIFLSYQWGKQPQIKALYKRLTALGYTVWMDIYQMGGGDSLYDKIDRGLRGCRAVVSCVTQKYSLSANCRREISLADALKKPIIPLLLEQIKWPPDGPMSMVFSELLYINFYKNEAMQMTWRCEQFDELVVKIGQFAPSGDINNTSVKAKIPSTTQGKGKEPLMTTTNSTSARTPMKGAAANTKNNDNVMKESPTKTSKENLKPNTEGKKANQGPKPALDDNKDYRQQELLAAENINAQPEPTKSKSCIIL